MDPVAALGVGMMILGAGIGIGILVRGSIAERDAADATAKLTAAREEAFDAGATAMHRILTPRPYRGGFPVPPINAARAYGGIRPQLFDQLATETETPDAR